MATNVPARLHRADVTRRHVRRRRDGLTPRSDAVRNAGSGVVVYLRDGGDVAEAGGARQARRSIGSTSVSARNTCVTCGATQIDHASRELNYVGLFRHSDGTRNQPLA